MERYTKSSYFRKFRCPAVLLKYVVQKAWMLSNSYLCRFKKTMTEEADDVAVDIFLADEEKEEDALVKTVISSARLDAARFTPLLLFVINECHLEAISDPFSITSSKYCERFRLAKVKYKSLDPCTLSI